MADETPGLNEPLTPGEHPEADPISDEQAVEADNTTTVHADTDTARDGPPAEDNPSSWIVVHANAHGAVFATRVTAGSAEAAEEMVASAHEDNTIEDVMPDHGEPTHGYGGSILTVVNLNEEP